jgi:biopolymer transport protein ExbD
LIAQASILLLTDRFTLIITTMAELAIPSGKQGARQLGKLPVRVDLTALVDLAFLLITFFMLATTLTKQKSMPLTMPVGQQGEPVAASSTMTVCLGKGNQVVYYLGQLSKPIIAPTVITGGIALEKVLLQVAQRVRAATGKSMAVVIMPSDHSIYNTLVSTLDELNITQTASYAISPITRQDVAMLKDRGVY